MSDAAEIVDIKVMGGKAQMGGWSVATASRDACKGAAGMTRRASWDRERADRGGGRVRVGE